METMARTLPECRFTGSRATFDVMHRARVAQQRHRHSFLFSLHVLVGLREIPGVAQDILMKAGLVDGFDMLTHVRKEFEKWAWEEFDEDQDNRRISTPTVLSAMDHVRYIPKPKNGHGVIEPEHVLYSLLLRDDEVLRILSLAGVNSDSVLHETQVWIEFMQVLEPIRRNSTD